MNLCNLYLSVVIFMTSPVSLVVVEEFGPFFCATQLIEVWRRLFLLSSLKVPPHRFNKTEVWSLTGWPQHLDSFSSAVLLQISCCLGSLFCCFMTQFGPNFSCWTDGLTFDSRIIWEPFSSQRTLCSTQWLQGTQVNSAQTITLPPPCLTDVWGVGADFLHMFLCIIDDKQVCFVSCLSPRHFFRSPCSYQAILPDKLYLSLSNCPVMTFSL